MIGPKKRGESPAASGQGRKAAQPLESAVSKPLSDNGSGRGKRKATKSGEGMDPAAKRVLGIAGAIVLACAVAAGTIAMTAPGKEAAPEGEPAATQGSRADGSAEAQGDESAASLTQMPNGDMAASYTSKVNADGSITYTYTDENGDKGVCTDVNGSGKADSSAAAAGTATAAEGSGDQEKAGKAEKEDAAAGSEEAAVDERELAALEQESCAHEYKPVYKTVKVKAEYKTIPHAAVTKQVSTSSTETVCNTCKAVITGHVAAHMASTGHTGYTKGVEVKGTKTVTVKKAWTEKVLVKKAATKKVRTGKEKCTICGKVKKAKRQR